MQHEALSDVEMHPQIVFEKSSEVVATHLYLGPVSTSFRFKFLSKSPSCCIFSDVLGANSAVHRDRCRIINHERPQEIFVCLTTVSY